MLNRSVLLSSLELIRNKFIGLIYACRFSLMSSLRLLILRALGDILGLPCDNFCHYCLLVLPYYIIIIIIIIR